MKPSVLASSSAPPLSRRLIIYCHPATWLSTASTHRRHSWRGARCAGSPSHSRPSMASSKELRTVTFQSRCPDTVNWSFCAGHTTWSLPGLAHWRCAGSSPRRFLQRLKINECVLKKKSRPVGEAGHLPSCGRTSLCICVWARCELYSIANQFTLFSSYENVRMIIIGG